MAPAKFEDEELKLSVLAEVAPVVDVAPPFVGSIWAPLNAPSKKSLVNTDSASLYLQINLIVSFDKHKTRF